MYIIKLWRHGKWVGATYEDKAPAREGFEQVKGYLGNPHISFRFSLAIDGQEVGEVVFSLGEFNRVELVELIGDEKLLDSHELKES